MNTITQVLKSLQYVPLALNVLHSVHDIENGKATTGQAPLSIHGVKGDIGFAFKPDADQTNTGASRKISLPLIISLITTIISEVAAGEPLAADAPMSAKGIRGQLAVAWTPRAA